MRCFALFAVAFLVPIASASADDVVILRDGATRRGTILESVPGEYVVIADASGARSRIHGSHVRFAGPADRAPNGSLARGAGVRVHFDAEAGFVFHRVRGRSVGTAWDHGPMDLEHLCTAPCATTLPAGSYRLALSSRDATWMAEAPLDLMRPGHVSAERVDRSGIRLAGWLTLALGAAAGIAMMAIPWSLVPDQREGWLLGGAAVLVTTVTTGLVLALQSDSVAIRFD